VNVIAVVLFLAIFASLGAALWALLFSRRGDRSQTLLKALTLRVGLSVLFFLLLMAAWLLGLIEPHGIMG
jgi:hypothetical protein